MYGTLVKYPWHTTQWSVVDHMLQQQRLPKALLFEGQAGLGKQDFANHLAAIVLCLNSDEMPCGHCRSCQLYRAGNHPDLYVLSPEEKAKNIKIDQVRSVTQKLQQTPQTATRQIVILSPLETLNTAAANALLKVLEEPPGEVLFILVANTLAYTPMTIVSRCQRVVFYGSNELATQQWLYDQLEQPEHASLLLSLAGNAPLAAQQMASTNFIALRDAVLLGLRDLHRAEKNPLELANAYCKDDRVLYITALIIIMMDILRISAGMTVAKLCNRDQATLLTQLAAQVDPVQCHLLYQHILQAKQWLTATVAINPQLLFESILIRWRQLKRG